VHLLPGLLAEVIYKGALAASITFTQVALKIKMKGSYVPRKLLNKKRDILKLLRSFS
jgi:hypothetical protein